MDHGGSIGGAGDIAAFTAALGRLSAAVGDPERIDQIRALEELKAAAAAAQARLTSAFVQSQRDAQREAGVDAEHIGRGIAAQVGLAKRESHYSASRYVGWARILTTELPHTVAALATGRVTERRAMIVARETAWLSPEHRTDVDAQLASKLERWSDRRVENETKRMAYRLDPYGHLARIRGARSDRHVSIRPAPDTMTRLTAFLPVEQGVAAYAALKRAADSSTATGDTRGRGQLMADTLVELVTGQAVAADVPIEINLVMTDSALFGTGDEPPVIEGHGPIPAPLARQLVTNRSDEVATWVRRLYTRPGSGELIALDSRRRTFTDGQRRFLIRRDETCRNSWCGAPIRHADHAIPAEHGGPTSISNGQGLCAACNHAKQAPGWSHTVHDNGDIDITTPTGHSYRSRAPAQPRAA